MFWLVGWLAGSGWVGISISGLGWVGISTSESGWLGMSTSLSWVVGWFGWILASFSLGLGGWNSLLLSPLVLTGVGWVGISVSVSSGVWECISTSV